MDELLYHGKVSARKKLKEKEICFKWPKQLYFRLLFSLKTNKKKESLGVQNPCFLWGKHRQRKSYLNGTQG